MYIAKAPSWKKEGGDRKWRTVGVVRGWVPVGVPEEVGAIDAEAEHGLCVGCEIFTQGSVVAELGSCSRLVEAP